MKSTIHEKLKTIQDAINYEIDQHYVNARGKKTTFSNFIIQNTKSLSFELSDKDKLKSLISLFFSYPSQDITSRMDTIHRAQQILKEISDKNKKSIFVGTKHFEKNLKKIDVKYVKGVGPKISQVLNRIGIFSVYDLFCHYPRSYIDYQSRKLIKDLKMDEEVTVVGSIKNTKSYNPPRRKDLTVFTIYVHDSSGRITLTRFIGGRFGKVIQQQYKKQYPIGAKVICSGKVSYDQFSRSFSLTNGIIEVVEEDKDTPSLNVARIVPVYPLTEGLSMEFLRKIISNGFRSYAELINETLPKKLIKDEKLLDLKTSLDQIHFPSSQQLCTLARYRIVFEEFFIMQLQLSHRRALIDKTRSGLALKEFKDSLIKKLPESLPFELTNAQKKAFLEIKQDLMSGKPMHRLLQGDVGSGKTIVALLALLFAVENGYQTALMAPTEILVHQHFRKFQDYCKGLINQTLANQASLVNIAMLTGSTPNKTKKEIYSGLTDGGIKIIVGTHALIQDEVKFNNLGLVIVDEQHRFGVKQRDELLKKGRNVERLFMTATPIPRTLALALHGDLELSEINELPKGRIPIKTSIIQSWQRQKTFDLIRGEVAKGRQVYIVFPLIEESEALSAKAATIEYEELSKNVFKDLKLGLMHGELPSAERDKVMQAFVNNESNILVTTTVIEVGVDVPNATVMMIENAERFGLSQLHQLRGRVGRGGTQAYCLLAPQTYSQEALRRLEILTKTNDGFVISQEDLKIRGPGEFLGTRQSGLPDLLLADLINDTETLETAREKAVQIVKEDPNLDNYPELRKIIKEKTETYIEAG